MLSKVCSDNDGVLLERRQRTPKTCRHAAAAAEKEYVIKLMANIICQHNLLTIICHNDWKNECLPKRALQSIHLLHIVCDNINALHIAFHSLLLL